MMKWRRPVLLAVILGLLALVHGVRDKRGSESSVTVSPPVVESPGISLQGGLTVLGDTGFARGYGSPKGSAEQDLQYVAELWDAAVLLIKDYDRFPLADNADITAFLLGKNPHHVAWIRPGHPAVNARHELTDRWGTPLFFHRESASRTGLRSAGPDRKLWTDDDIIRPAP